MKLINDQNEIERCAVCGNDSFTAVDETEIHCARCGEFHKSLKTSRDLIREMLNEFHRI